MILLPQKIEIRHIFKKLKSLRSLSLDCYCGPFSPTGNLQIDDSEICNSNNKYERKRRVQGENNWCGVFVEAVREKGVEMKHNLFLEYFDMEQLKTVSELFNFRYSSGSCCSFSFISLMTIKANP